VVNISIKFIQDEYVYLEIVYTGIYIDTIFVSTNLNLSKRWKWTYPSTGPTKQL